MLSNKLFFIFGLGSGCKEVNSQSKATNEAEEISFLITGNSSPKLSTVTSHILSGNTKDSFLKTEADAVKGNICNLWSTLLKDQALFWIVSFYLINCLSAFWIVP